MNNVILPTEKIRDSDGLWLNSNVFRTEAIKFMDTGRYCSDPKGTPSYMEYWDEQLRRCKEGYSVNGQKITQHHYSYLNFSQIEVVKVDKDGNESSTADKETKCPDFWDGDYDYYWALEISKNGLFNSNSLATTILEKEVYKHLPLEQQNKEKQRVLKRIGMRVIPHPDFLDGGHHMIVGKSRRKGYSFKNADICKNVYNTVRNSLTVIGAFDKKYLYPKGTMGMASGYLSFLNKHTAWGKGREYVDKQEHKRASFKETLEGISVEAGYMSEIMAVTFKDNPQVARGKDAKYVLLEEAGAFPNLKESFNATAPGLTAGRYITGQILIFGTGGDMESGTVDFADMFYNPEQYNLMPFVNIWDENAENSYCGFFHPVSLNMEGFYDEQGNSDMEGAKKFELKVRAKIIKSSTSSNAIQSRVQEWPLCPSEAFLTVNTNDFPVVELRQQFNKIKRENLNLIMGQACYLSRESKNEISGVVVAPDGTISNHGIYKSGIKINLDLGGELNPLWDYKIKSKDLKGSVVIYEPPVYNPPKGLYKIGFDPYRQVNGASLAAIYVYKTIRKSDTTMNIIVAQYIGRPYSPDEVNRIAVMLAELYNTEVMHENEVTHVKGYFEKKKKLQFLAAQPNSVISANIKDSIVARVYGIHMVDKLKDAGEKYIKEWLLTIRGYDSKTGEAILNLHTIYDPGLLEELILYNRKGNFDRVMAFMMVMFQVEEDSGIEYSENYINQNAKDLLDLMKNQFTNE